MHRRFQRGSRLGVPALAVMALTVACSWQVHASSTTDEVWVSFSGGKAGDPITSVKNVGTAATTQTIRKTNGGQLVYRYSGVGTGLAADFPAYDGARNGARAVIALTNSGTVDQLNPGARPFVIGADVKLDATNEGTVYDDGNNLVQRGLYTEPAQYKLQIDGNRFSCRVKGDSGALEKWSSLTLTPGVWYRATCTREVLDTGDRIVLTVATIAADGSTGTPKTWSSGIGPVGKLSFALGIPMSLGGKLNPDLSITSDPDMLNGVLDNTYLDIR